MKRILLFLALCSLPALAVDEFYSISRSIRALGMGGAFYGMSDDQDALFYNPAGLSMYRGDPKVMFSVSAIVSDATVSAFSEISELAKGNNTTKTVIDDLASFSGKPIYAEVSAMPVYYIRKNFAIGLLLADPKLQMALLGADFDTSVDVTLISDTGIVMGYGQSVTDNLHLGMNMKGILRTGGYKQYTILELAQQGGISADPTTIGGTGFGVDFDFGAIYDVPKLPFGVLNQVSLTLNNVLASDFNLIHVAGTGTPPPLDRLLSVGFHSVLPGYGWIDNFHLLLDFAEFQIGGETDPNLGARSGDFAKHVNMGIEMPMNWFVLRAGIHEGDWTAGFGLRSKFVEIDFATYTEELELNLDKLNSRRFAVKLSFGWGSTPPPPVEAKTSFSEWEVGNKAEKVTPPSEAKPVKIETGIDAKPEGKVDDKSGQKPVKSDVQPDLKPQPTPLATPTPTPTPTPSSTPSSSPTGSAWPTASPTSTPPPQKSPSPAGDNGAKSGN